jgi:hypothetical protein
MFCKVYCADVMNHIRIGAGKTDITIGCSYGESGKFAFQN